MSVGAAVNLEQVSIFRYLPREVLTRLAALGRERIFGPGQELLRQGEPAVRLYAILRGTVRVEVSHPALNESWEMPEVGPGDVIGLERLLRSAGDPYATPSPYGARAVSRVLAFELSYTALALTVLQHPAAADTLYSAIGQQRSLDQAPGGQEPGRPT